MARYGCLAISVVVALIILFGIVYLWSGWYERPGPGQSGGVVPTPAQITSAQIMPSPPGKPFAGGLGEIISPSVTPPQIPKNQ